MLRKIISTGIILLVTVAAQAVPHLSEAWLRKIIIFGGFSPENLLFFGFFVIMIAKILPYGIFFVNSARESVSCLHAVTHRLYNLH